MLNKSNNGRTRRINPKFGFLGFLGFAGFLGIWTYQVSHDTFPFIFFAFFGFFSFFFEGKMSNILMDERYMENRVKAQLTAFRVGCVLSFLTLAAISMDRPFTTDSSKLIFVTVALSLIIAMVLFLTEFLLYYYDSKDTCED